MENFSRDFLLFISSFLTISANFSKFGAENIILFQIKVFRRNIEETMLARYFIKVTARSSFARLMVIRQKKKSLNINIENTLQRFSCTSFLLKLL